MDVISQRAYALVIIMTAVTTVLPPPFLKMLFTAEDRTASQASLKELPAEAQVSGQVS
jgi:hypothetical protein